MVDLKAKRNEILKAWLNHFLDRYPIKPSFEITDFFEECLAGILDKLIEFYDGGSLKGVEEHLDNLARYLASDPKLSAGGSMASVFYLKKIFLDLFPKMSKEEFVKLSEAVDILICKAFDHFMSSREKLIELKYKERENRLRMEMKAYDFCMKKCPYVQKARELGIDPWDLPMEEIDRLLAEKRSKEK